MLGRYGTIEAIPASAAAWDIAALSTSRVVSLAATLRADRDLALLFKKLATCVVDRAILPAGAGALDSLEWQGPGPVLWRCASASMPRRSASGPDGCRRDGLRSPNPGTTEARGSAGAGRLLPSAARGTASG